MSSDESPLVNSTPTWRVESTIELHAAQSQLYQDYSRSKTNASQAQMLPLAHFLAIHRVAFFDP
jgi:hypothetical protein